MENLEQQIAGAAKDAIRKSIVDALAGYHSPMHKLCDQVVARHSAELEELVEAGVSAAINSDQFKTDVIQTFQHKLAKMMVSKLEGSVEKCVETLRQSPILRAKMTLAIEQIIKEVHP